MAKTFLIIAVLGLVVEFVEPIFAALDRHLYYRRQARAARAPEGEHNG